MKNRVSVGAAALVAGSLFCLVSMARAEEERGLAFPAGPLKLTLTLDATAAAMSVQNAQNGIGSRSIANERTGGRHWAEGFLKPALGMEWLDFGGGTLYGKVSVIGTATRGNGEAQATATTSDQPEYLAVNDLYLGWRSGAVTGDFLPEDAFDISVGHQEFLVGDGFLLVNGTQDASRRAAYYIGPRNSFERTAIVRINTAPVRADLFRLENGVDQRLMRASDNPATTLYGANLEWFTSTEGDAGRFTYDKRQRYAGLTFIKITDADRNFSFNGSQPNAVGANRDGATTVSARAGGQLVPGVEALALYGEYGIQRNSAGATGGTVRANAWYVQPQYTFADVAWAPVLTARYAHFSGDGATGDRVDRSWDPLFSDAGPRGSTTWTQGVIYSQYVGANTNLNTRHVGLRAEPVETVLKLGVSWFGHEFDKPSQAGARSKRLLDEVDVSADWTTPVPGLTVSPLVGMGIPGAGQKQALGTADANNRTIWLMQVVATYLF